MHTLTPRADFSQRNAALLAAYQQCRSTANRNAVIHANLPLVWRIVSSKAPSSALGYGRGCVGSGYKSGGKMAHGQASTTPAEAAAAGAGGRFVGWHHLARIA